MHKVQNSLKDHRNVDNGTYLQSIQFVTKVLLLIKELLESIGEYDICVIQAAVLLVKVLILILIIKYIVISIVFL